MSFLLEKLSSKKPCLWVEVSPPRGINCATLLARLGALRGHADAINLADNAMGRVKLSALVFASMIKSRLELPVVVNFSCRDRNLLALKSDLLGAAALGIDGVTALTGDKIEAGPHGAARTVRDVDVFGLLRIIGELNRGDTGEGKRLLLTLPRLLAGTVANPNRRNLAREFDLLVQKAESGARYVITQPVFNLEPARSFSRRASALGLKVMLGILPVKRAEMAAYLKRNVRELDEAHGHLNRYEGLNEQEAKAVSIRESMALMRELTPEVAGFNIMSGGGPSLAAELALEFSRWRERA